MPLIRTFSVASKLVPSRKVATLDDNIVTQSIRDERNGSGQETHRRESTSDDVTNHKLWVKSKVQDKGYSTTTVISTALSDVPQEEKNVWSQNQQKLFEKALASVTKDAPDRWIQIARNVPGKTKVSLLAWVPKFFRLMTF